LKKFVSFLLRAFSFLVVLLLSVWVTFVLWDKYEWRTRYYKTYEEAINNHYSKNGWIRSFVPLDAYETAEWHELSPQEQTLSFNFKDSDNFKRQIEDYSYRSSNPKKITQKQVKWLPRRFSSGDIVDFYHMPDDYGTGCLIVIWSSKEAYFRSTGCIKQ
jgi:hypothetical protein